MDPRTGDSVLEIAWQLMLEPGETEARSTPLEASETTIL